MSDSIRRIITATLAQAPSTSKKFSEQAAVHGSA
jgi:hypothetical protein